MGALATVPMVLIIEGVNCVEIVIGVAGKFANVTIGVANAIETMGVLLFLCAAIGAEVIMIIVIVGKNGLKIVSYSAVPSANVTFAVAVGIVNMGDKFGGFIAIGVGTSSAMSVTANCPVVAPCAFVFGFGFFVILGISDSANRTIRYLCVV